MNTKQMNTNILWMAILMVFISGLAQSQNNMKIDSFSVYAEEDWYEDDPYFWSNSKEVGLNFMPLISKLVPFNFIERPEGMVGLTYKRYYSKRAFRVAFGANLSEQADFDNNIFLHLSVGLERRYPITKDKKVTYTSGWEAAFMGRNEGATLGMSKIYGIEYHFSKRVFLSTEAFLLFGLDLDFGGPAFRFSPPTSIFVNVRLY